MKNITPFEEMIGHTNILLLMLLHMTYPYIVLFHFQEKSKLDRILPFNFVCLLF